MNDENMTSVFSIRRVACKPPFKAKEIRKELAAYFLNKGRVEWQNDYALRWYIFKQPHFLDFYSTFSQTVKFMSFYLSCSVSFSVWFCPS
jgi:hypothetical protein